MEEGREKRRKEGGREKGRKEGEKKKEGFKKLNQERETKGKEEEK